MLKLSLVTISILISANLFSSDTHWECVPNNDFIEYADCTEQCKQVRVQTPDQLGDNFTLNAKFLQEVILRVPPRMESYLVKELIQMDKLSRAS